MPSLRALSAAALAAAAVPLAFCGGSSSGSSPTAPTTTTTPTQTTTTTTSLPSIYRKFGNGTSVTLVGQTVVITTTDIPDHPSPYFGVGNANYVAPQPGMVPNPNMISAQNVTFKIPVTPAKAAPSDTPLGPMGIATNGVVLYNQYAAGRTPLTTEIVSFDQYDGHPNGQNQYHYHLEPLWLTAKGGKSTFIGVLLDGYPVYGPQDADGSTPSNLDGCNGHTGVTPDFPSGIYHYHIVSAPPYIAGCFYGAPGTVTQG